MSAPALELARAVVGRERSALDTTREALARVASANGPLNAFIEVCEDEALAAAARVDQRLAAGERLPLAGVPIGVKGNICTLQGRTTCGSAMLSAYRSPFPATCVRRLEDAGAVVIGKTNLDEFGMGSSTEHSVHGPTRNPWDHARVPGGSSGGSAAAVAAEMVPIALGTDTGGSVRQPASFCGVVGFKPTYGRVSRSGLVAYASSLDQAGPIASTIADAALALSVMGGFDPADATSADQPAPDLLAACDRAIERPRIGVPAQALSPANHPEVRRIFEEAVGVWRRLGADIIEIDLPTLDAGIAAYYIVATAEASSNLARFDGIRYGRRAQLAPGEGLPELYARGRAEGFGPEVKRRILLGTYVLSSGYYDAYYQTALKARRLIKRDFDAALTAPASPGGGAGCHAVLMPTAPSPAFRAGEKSGDPLAMYLEDFYTVTVNLAGLPAVSIPAGWASVDASRLPVGVQLIGAAFDEATLVALGAMFESAAGVPRTPPRA